MRQKVRLVLLSNYCVFRQCLAHALDQHGSFRVVAHKAITTEALETIQNLHPELLVIDANYQHPQELDLVEQAIRQLPATRVVLLVPGQLQTDRLPACPGGGYVSRNAGLEEMAAVLSLLLGQAPPVSPELGRLLLRQLRAVAAGVPPAASPEPPALTMREQQVLQLLAAGQNNSEISATLGLSVYTVKNHVHHILEKLGVHSRHQAVQVAQEHGWLTPPATPEPPS